MYEFVDVETKDELTEAIAEAFSTIEEEMGYDCFNGSPPGSDKFNKVS